MTNIDPQQNRDRYFRILDDTSTVWGRLNRKLRNDPELTLDEVAPMILAIGEGLVALWGIVGTATQPDPLDDLF